MKKFRVFVVVLCLIAIVAVCLVSSNAKTAKPITLTMFCADLNHAYERMESAVGKEITKKTGVKLEIEYPVGDYKQKLNLMAASGTYPDLIYAKEEVGTLIKSKGLVDMAPLIEKYGKNIKKFYGDMFYRNRYSQEDPSIYFLGNASLGNYDLGHVFWGNCFQLQIGALKESGYPKVKNLKEYEKVIKDYIAKNPTTPDGQKTIGMTLCCADGWRYFITLTNPACLATGGPDDGEFYFDPAKNYKPILHHRRAEEKEYFRWLNHMYNEGLLDQESFTQTYDAYIAKIASGRVVGLADALWQYNSAVSKLKQDQKNDKLYASLPVVLDDTKTKFNVSPNGFSATKGVSITKSCKNPTAAIKLLDFLCSDEGQVLTHWGIQGVHYEVKNGARVFKPEWAQKKKENGTAFSKETGIYVYTFPFPQYATGVKDAKGMYYTETFESNEIASDATEAEREAFAAYGITKWVDLFPKVSEFKVKPYGNGADLKPQTEEGKIADKKCHDIIFKDIVQAIVATPDKFDELWDQFMKDLDNAGVTAYEADVEQQLRKRISFWSKSKK